MPAQQTAQARAEGRPRGAWALVGAARRCGLLVRRTIRKHPGLVGATLVLSLIAGLLSNIALVMLTQHSSYLEAKAAEWSSPDIVAVLPQDERAQAVEDDLRAEERIAALEVADCVTVQGSIAYSLPSGFLFYDIEDTPAMGRWDVASQAGRPMANPVWVPSTLQEAGGYELGDELVLTSPMGKRTFHIQGFVESTYGGRPSMGLLWLGLPRQDLQDLQAEAQAHMAALRAEWEASGRGGAQSPDLIPGWVPSTLIKARVQGGFEAGREVIAASAAEHGATGVWDMDRELVSLDHQTSVGVVAVIVLLFSSMITAMAVLMLVFMLRAAIGEDLGAVGMLRAAGFTTGGVMGPMVLCLAAVAAVGAGLGAGLGHIVLPLLSRMLRAQTGVTWRAQADPLLLLGCAMALGTVVLVSGALVAWRASRITTVGALRGGQADHSFTRARLPLQRARGPLAILLGIACSGPTGDPAGDQGDARGPGPHPAHHRGLGGGDQGDARGPGPHPAHHRGLGGLHAGLGLLRLRAGDALGSGQRPVPPAGWLAARCHRRGPGRRGRPGGGVPGGEDRGGRGGHVLQHQVRDR